MSLECVDKAFWVLRLNISLRIIMADKVFKELPRMHTTYANIIKSLLPSGDNQANRLPTCVYSVERLLIDESNLKEYRKICKFVNDGRVPVTYFAVLSQTLQMNMMAKEEFPFAMLGLVHVSNSVTQYRPVFDTEIGHMSVHLQNLSAHDKGQTFDFVTQVTIGGELVWEGVSTYLSRQKKPSTAQPKTNTTTNETEFVGELIGTIDVSEDIGRRYAFISGDFNLIHLHPLSAKAFGFPKAIAHGMWSKARSLSQFHDLPRAYRVDVVFKAPIILPSKVRLLAQDTQTGKNFALYASSSDKAHLLGKITYL